MKYIHVLMLVIFISNCSSITARLRENTQFGRPYAGLDHALDNALECNVATLWELPPAIIISIPLSVVDIVGSLVLDTLLVPVDLLIDKPKKGIKSLCHIDMSH